ncbi:hypothetical protein [Pseudomonas serbica]|jgi:hypothetical protein|uniref:hypothetical protein n=1 Tax=Pseudomonas serbica TaxID=2965074 RepID=UPI00237AC562|nr:hypothetical protein [Pseudomonas serbica]
MISELNPGNPCESDTHDQAKALRQLEHGATFPYDGDNDNPTPATDWAHAAARGVLANLLDRGGVGNALEDLDEELRDEIVSELALIIRLAPSQTSGE